MLSSHRNLQWVLILYFSYVRILALQFIAIAPRFSSPWYQGTLYLVSTGTWYLVPGPGTPT